jgi:hypothetical protein
MSASASHRGGRSALGAHVGESDRAGHEGGNATSDLGNLCLNVPEVGEARPAPQLLDDIRVVAEDLKLNGAGKRESKRKSLLLPTLVPVCKVVVRTCYMVLMRVR